MNDTPLLVGVTGHRDLTEASTRQATEQVRRFFTSLKERLPHTPVCLMTGLAEGADQLAAQAALEAGFTVQAVLPMPAELYENDFSAESLQAFRKLISSKGVEVVELPLPEYMTREQAEKQGEDRDQLYARLGDYLIERSSILVALWDGRDNQLLGGTSDVLLRYLKAGGAPFSNSSEIRLVDTREDGFQGSEFVYWVPVTRMSGDVQPIPLEGESCYLSGGLGQGILCRHLKVTGELAEQLSHLDAYNSQYRNLIETGKFYTWGGLLDKLPNKECHHLLPELESIDAEYQKSDGLALFNQKHSDRQFKLFAYMAALMGLLFLLYAKIIALKVFLIGYLALFIAGFFMHRQTARRHWFTNHLLQRLIAETLRTRFYLVLAGVDKRVDTDKLLNLFGIDQFSGFSWIKHVFRSHHSLDDDSVKVDQQKTDVEFVCTAWLEDQARYFRSKIEKLSEHHHHLEKIKGKLLLASVGAVVLLILFKKFLVGTTLLGSLDLKTLVVFLMGLLPFWLGVWEIYQSKMAVKELLWQYRNQSNLFSLMSTRIEYSRSIDEKRQILAELGERSLTENYLWTIHRYHREHEPPTAG